MKAEEKKAMLTKFMALIEGKADVFHSPEPDKEPFIRADVGDHKENFPLREKGLFRDWAQYICFSAFGAALPKEIFKPILEQLQAQAKFGAPEFPTPLRVAEKEGHIYLDLCNEKWDCIKITSRGWGAISDPPVRFRRSPGMLPLPMPERGGNVQDLFRFINVKNPSDKILSLAWLLGAFRPAGPYPILALYGSQGSAKTTTETFLRRMIDPAIANLSGVPRDERDLLISVKHSYLLGFDNFSHISETLSDALCRVATGSGLTTRKLYTDDTQTVFNGCRPILLNGIADLATRGDLLDRMIVLHLPKIQESERREERTLMQEFESSQPLILGAILDAVSHALRRIKDTSRKFSVLPRMADFTVWTAAGAEALGFTAQDFISAYEQNRIEANFIALENAPAAVEILRFVKERVEPWEGTCSQLLSQLNALTTDDVRRDQYWPKSARALSSLIGRCEPNLNAAGVSIIKLPREGGTGQRKYRLSYVTSSQLQILKEAA